ncbi:MAG: hypothetical protein ABL898_14215 [Hyphomicrobiaceae bacterium]|nr:hypothetical protein [Hyphomicrobiaceae bacterium]
MSVVDALLLALAVTAVGCVFLVAMVIPVTIPGETESYGKGLTDTTVDFGLIPLHTRFLHPATTAYWRACGFRVLLSAARACFFGGLAAVIACVALYLSGSPA